MFFISAFLILFSSYLLLSVICKKNNVPFLLYFLLTAFSQIILTFEILSLLNEISSKNFLSLNIIFSAITILYWLKNKKPIYKTKIKDEIQKIINAIKRDKLLIFLSICFIIFIFSTLYISIYYPITFGDVLKYTLTRCTTWIQQENLNHFITPDTREIIMPINMELLYTWVLLFTKKESGIACFSFISYSLGIYVIYNLLGALHFCRRKRIWSIFCFSGLALIGVMAHTPCSDILIGALILSSIYSFYLYCKNSSKMDLYFSTLAYALAIGTKTTAIMIIPSVAIILILLLLKYKKSNIKHSILYFINFSIFNFLIFSSYNYILNFIQFSNPISNQEQLLIHQFDGGYKGFISNLIKYFFVMFDLSGIQNIDKYNSFITTLQTKTLSFIGLTPNSYMSEFFKENFKYNNLMTISTAGFGAIGLLLFLPSLFKSKRNFLLFLLGISTIINIIVISKTMLFSQYNIRYLAAFITISSPIFVFSYTKSNKNIYKLIVTLFLFIYLFWIPHTKALAYMLNSNKIKIEREEIAIYNFFKEKETAQIGLISNQEKQALYDIEKLKLIGFKIDKILVENIEIYDLENYKYIITDVYKTSSTDIKKFGKRQNKSAYITQCLYTDSNMRIIENNENKKPAKVDCLIPFEYLKSNNYNENNTLQLKNYIIWEK